MSDDANNTSRPRVRYEQSPNGEVVRVMCGGIAHFRRNSRCTLPRQPLGLSRMYARPGVHL